MKDVNTYEHTQALAFYNKVATNIFCFFFDTYEIFYKYFTGYFQYMYNPGSYRYFVYLFEDLK